MLWKPCNIQLITHVPCKSPCMKFISLSFSNIPKRSSKTHSEKSLAILGSPELKSFPLSLTSSSVKPEIILCHDRKLFSHVWLIRIISFIVLLFYKLWLNWLLIMKGITNPNYIWSQNHARKLVTKICWTLILSCDIVGTSCCNVITTLKIITK